MNPKIIQFTGVKLLGCSTRMSVVKNQTASLWQQLMPQRQAIKHQIGSDLYSLEVYDSLSYFDQFDPNKPFTKWAGIPVEKYDYQPEGLEQLTVTAGLHAVFTYRGNPNEAYGFYNSIYGEWLPQSAYQLDLRPHFAVMGEKYQNHRDSSEEEIWVPIQG